MIIRFENDNVEHTIEARRYSVVRKGEFTTVVVWPKNPIENTEDYLMIPGSFDDWQRMYVMNDTGKTIDTLRAPELPISGE
jgi:hypothetical protein